MDHVKRTERLSAIARMLVEEPGRSFPLSQFCDTFSAAKSTISEDLDIIRNAFEAFSLGQLETLPGASGGVRFRHALAHPAGFLEVSSLCERLAVPERALPGGLLFLADIIADPRVMGRMGAILASEFFACSPDFVLTMETQGIPLAVMAARCLNIPAVIARRSSRPYEGPAVHISYLAGAQFKTMSLSRHLVRPGQRALLVDDVLRSGGTATGMMDLMREFSAEVVGAAMLLGTQEACARFPDIKPLMVLEELNHEKGIVRLRPGDWLAVPEG